MEWRPVKRGIKIFLVASCYRHQVKFRPNEPLDLDAHLLPSWNVVTVRSEKLPTFVNILILIPPE